MTNERNAFLFRFPCSHSPQLVKAAALLHCVVALAHHALCSWRAVERTRADRPNNGFLFLFSHGTVFSFQPHLEKRDSKTASLRHPRHRSLQMATSVMRPGNEGSSPSPSDPGLVSSFSPPPSGAAPSSKESLLRDRRKYIGYNVALNYSESPLLIVKGQGQYLFDEVRSSLCRCSVGFGWLVRRN